MWFHALASVSKKFAIPLHPKYITETEREAGLLGVSDTTAPPGSPRLGFADYREQKLNNQKVCMSVRKCATVINTWNLRTVKRIPGAPNYCRTFFVIDKCE